VSRRSITLPPPPSLAEDLEARAKQLRNIAAGILAQANDLDEVAKETRRSYGEIVK